MKGKKDRKCWVGHSKWIGHGSTRAMDEIRGDGIPSKHFIISEMENHQICMQKVQ